MPSNGRESLALALMAIWHQHHRLNLEAQYVIFCLCLQAFLESWRR